MFFVFQTIIIHNCERLKKPHKTILCSSSRAIKSKHLLCTKPKQYETFKTQNNSSIAAADTGLQSRSTGILAWHLQEHIKRTCQMSYWKHKAEKPVNRASRSNCSIRPKSNKLFTYIQKHPTVNKVQECKRL